MPINNCLRSDQFLPFVDAATGLISLHTAATVMQPMLGNLNQNLNSNSITLAVLSTTGNTAFEIDFETVPFEQSDVAYAVFHTMTFADDSGVAAPKFQTITIPGKFGVIRANLVSISGGGVRIYAVA